MYSNEDILFPIFLKCCKLCKDSNFWSTIFQDLSKGIPPYGTYISKNYLCCSYKNKEFSYFIDNTLDSETVYKDIKRIFINKLQLTSLNEKIEKFKSIQENNNVKEDIKCWSDIRKKNARNIFLDKFIVEKSKDNNLSLKQSKTLLKLIYYFILIRTISHKNIIFENGKIESIKGITFSDKNIHIDNELHKENFNESNIKSVPNLMKNNWDKYIKDIYKLCQSIE